MKKIYFSQDLSRWAEKSPIIDAYDEEFICKVDKAGYQGPTINLVGDKGTWYTGIEYINIEKNRRTFFEEIASVSISEDISFIMTNAGMIKAEIIKLLREANNGYIILMGPIAAKINQSMEDFRDRVRKYQDMKMEMSQMEKELEALKTESKKDKDNKEIEDKIESLSRDILYFKKDIKDARNQQRASSFMIEFFMDLGVFNIFRGFEPVYTDKDLMILKVLPRLKHGITNTTIETFLNCQSESIAKNLKTKEVINLIQEYTKASEVTFQYEVPENQSSLDLLGSISDFPDLSFDSTVYMTDAIPVAPIKPNIVASLLASGTAGKLDRDIKINKEECTIKSVMLQKESISTTFINGEEVIEKISTWKPRLGIFNKLRKEIEILTD